MESKAGNKHLVFFSFATATARFTTLVAIDCFYNTYIHHTIDSFNFVFIFAVFILHLFCSQVERAKQTVSPVSFA